MNQELKEKWCAALESGHYIQGNGKLKNMADPERVTYCCLGVLREVGALPTSDTSDYQNGDMLSHDQRTAAGMSEGMQRLLARLNDSGSWTFNDIARYVRGVPDMTYENPETPNKSLT